MALAVTIYLEFKDAKNKSSGTKIRVPTGFSIEQYVEFAQGAAQVIANLSTGRIVNVSVNFALDLSGATFTNVQNVLADVSSKAQMLFNSAVAGLRAKFRIPTFDEDNLVITGTDQIDQTALPVATFITAIEDGYAITGGNMAPTDKRGNDLVLLTVATELFQKRRAG